MLFCTILQKVKLAADSVFICPPQKSTLPLKLPSSRMAVRVKKIFIFKRLKHWNFDYPHSASHHLIIFVAPEVKMWTDWFPPVSQETNWARKRGNGPDLFLGTKKCWRSSWRRSPSPFIETCSRTVATIRPQINCVITKRKSIGACWWTRQEIWIHVSSGKDGKSPHCRFINLVLKQACQGCHTFPHWKPQNDKTRFQQWISEKSFLDKNHQKVLLFKAKVMHPNPLPQRRRRARFHLDAPVISLSRPKMATFSKWYGSLVKILDQRLFSFVANPHSAVWPEGLGSVLTVPPRNERPILLIWLKFLQCPALLGIVPFSSMCAWLRIPFK